MRLKNFNTFGKYNYKFIVLFTKRSELIIWISLVPKRKTKKHSMNIQ